MLARTMQRTVELRGNDGTCRLPFRSEASVALERWLASSIVLQEDYDALPRDVRDEIEERTTIEELLPILVEQGLLTEYQARRLEAGTVHGLILGNYRVLDRLGAGGMGVVFKAEHVDLRRPVAIKVLSSFADDDFRLQQRFLAEMRVVAQLQHPNIVGAMDAGKLTAPNAPTLRYFVMELVPGQDLEELVREHGPLTSVKACDIVHQIAAALAESHKHQLVHRDIKPSNVRVGPDGQAKLLDFGLARSALFRMTDPGSVLGTLDYMAPEQVIDAGAVDIRADIYALGGTLFWCLTGRSPFVAQDTVVQQIAYRKTQPAPSVRSVRPEIPCGLDALVAKMMALDPGERFSAPQELMQAILPFLKPEMREGANLLARRTCESVPAEAAARCRRILVVDDEPDILRFCRCVLQAEENLQCETANGGAEALELLRVGRFDLVLIDVDMPRMSGPELCRRLRDDPPFPNLKIIMMSGRAPADEMSRMLLNGSDDYISKPLSLVQFQSKVKAALRLKEAQDQSDRLTSQLLAVNRDLEQAVSGRDSDLIHARNGLVHALAKLVESREGESDSRLDRMGRYARILAEEAAAMPAFAGQIDENFVDLLACCAPLHDIGKVGLPDHVLLKPGKLDGDERLLMQTHTVIGSDTLKSAMSQHGSALAFLQMAADIARSHHERYDGVGYPDGLVGDAIPLSARIVAVCDVYDALRSRRSYKPALSHPTAVQIMNSLSRGQFDPNLLHAFERCAGEFARIFAGSK